MKTPNILRCDVVAHPRYGSPICCCLVCGYFNRFCTLQRYTMIAKQCLERLHLMEARLVVIRRKRSYLCSGVQWKHNSFVAFVIFNFEAEQQLL